MKGPLTFSNTCKILNNAIVYVCLIVLLFKIVLPTNYQLKKKEVIFISNGNNLL